MYPLGSIIPVLHGAMMVLLFVVAMIFGAIANACAFFILGRMRSLGFSVGLWRGRKDLQLYSAYWKIAPKQGWSRFPLVAFVVALVVAGIFLFRIVLGIH
jgi:hypothetical protein